MGAPKASREATFKRLSLWHANTREHVKNNIYFISFLRGGGVFNSPVLDKNGTSFAYLVKPKKFDLKKKLFTCTQIYVYLAQLMV